MPGAFAAFASTIAAYAPAISSMSLGRARSAARAAA